MYLPPAFAEDRPEPLRDLIRGHPLGILVTQGAKGLQADHVPFMWVASDARDAHGAAEAPGAGLLRAHLAKANPAVEALRGGAEALVVFQGPDAYVTPSWYASKREHGRVVPTWNYATAHVWGAPRVIEDPAWLAAQVEAITKQQEGGRAAPWAVGDAPDRFIQGQLRGIVGLEIAISRVQGKFKLSQNKPEDDRAGVAEGLRAEPGGGATAALMAARETERDEPSA